MGIDKPGSREMTYLADFFRYADFSTLIPRFNDPAYSDLTEESKLAASSENADTYIAYFCNPDTSAGTLMGLRTDRTYSAKWYNPLTGKFVEIADNLVFSDGRYTVPAKPTSGDWALLVTCRTDLGSYETEIPFAPIADTGLPDSAVRIFPEITCAGSHIYTADGEGANTVDALSDGNPDTEWVPFAPIASQTICMDLQTVKTVYRLCITPGREAVIPPYRVEGSADGMNWTILADSTLSAPTVTEQNGCREIREPLAGNYRYIRLLWFGAGSNTAVKTIADLALWAEA